MSVLIKPIITEKSQTQIATGKYSFQVALKANKIEIAKAIEAMYGVTVANVSTLRQFGKSKSRMSRSKVTTGRTSTFKKAIVTLQEGDMIDFYADL